MESWNQKCVSAKDIVANSQENTRR